MGFRYSKRYGGSKGWGLNVSGSGISSSYRGKYGTIGSRGFSIKTSVPGLTYRHSWGSSKSLGGLVILAIMLPLAMLYITIVISYNLLRLAIWTVRKLIILGIYLYDRWKEYQSSKQGIPPAERAAISVDPNE